MNKLTLNLYLLGLNQTIVKNAAAIANQITGLKISSHICT